MWLRPGQTFYENTDVLSLIEITEAEKEQTTNLPYSQRIPPLNVFKRRDIKIKISRAVIL